jgi:RHS repeat-associated protein
MRIKDDTSEHVFYLFADHLGSTNVVSDPNGLIVSVSLYKPWGGSRNGGSGTSLTDYAYTGQRKMDDLVGLYYYGARFYDSYLNQWNQADIIIADPYNPLDWNRYSYVRNNPVTANDPTGHLPNWINFVMGATCQYMDDMSFGLFSQVSGDLDNNTSEAFQNGRQTGRFVSTTVATLGEIEGAAVVGAMAAGILPTAGGSLAAAPVTGGASVIVGGVAVTGEAVVAAGGAVTAVYGGSVMAKIMGDPIGGTNAPTIDDLLRDPSSFAGKTQAEIEALVLDSWQQSPLAKGAGVRYINPDKPGQAIFFEQGWPNATDPLHSGPYLKVSAGTGEPVRIPLAGNPMLGK